MIREGLAAALVGGALGAALAGCATSQAYVSRSLDDTPRLWTAVAVWGDRAPVGHDDRAVLEEAVEAALGDTTRFVPRPLPARVRAALEDGSPTWRDGPPPGLLVDLSRGQGVDALALVTVRALDPYPPARLSLAIEVHSTETGALLFSNAATVEGQPGSTIAGDSLAGRRRPASRLSRSELARAACEELLAPIETW